MSALRTTGVAPILVRSSVWIPFAFSSRRIISPIIADSLESFEETTTAACSGGDTVRPSAPATHSDFRRFTRRPLPTARGRRSRSAAHCRLLLGSSSPRNRVCCPALRFMMAGSDESGTEVPPDTCECGARVERPLFGLATVSRGSHRPARLVARLGEAGTSLPLPRRDRRRRWSWTGDGLLPRHRVRHYRRGGAGEGPYRAGQRRSQHHHHPLQLLPPGQYPLLRVLAEAVGRSRAQAELQCDGEPARRPQPVSHRRAARSFHAARKHDAPPRGGCGAVEPRGGEGAGATR